LERKIENHHLSENEQTKNYRFSRIKRRNQPGNNCTHCTTITCVTIVFHLGCIRYYHYYYYERTELVCGKRGVNIIPVFSVGRRKIGIWNRERKRESYTSCESNSLISISTLPTITVATVIHRLDSDDSSSPFLVHQSFRSSRTDPSIARLNITPSPYTGCHQHTSVLSRTYAIINDLKMSLFVCT
jgi:hypothetical protein